VGLRERWHRLDGMTKRALSSKGVSVVTVEGQDCGEVIRRHAARMHDAHKKAEQRQREYDAVHHYDHETGTETFVCLVKRAGLGIYTATTVTEVGTAGLVTCMPTQERFLEADMRMALMRAFVAGRVCKNYIEAREKAAKCKFILERSEAFGSAKGEGVSA
jgi:hypothetical protein